MTIRRFDANPWIEDGEAQVTFEAVPSGSWVRYADHAAEVAALIERAERAERAERYVDNQNLRSDYRTATEMRAALERAEKERDTLRDEVRAWRASDGSCDEAVCKAVTKAILATDAAGIKGVE